MEISPLTTRRLALTANFRATLGTLGTSVVRVSKVARDYLAKACCCKRPRRSPKGIIRFLVCFNSKVSGDFRDSGTNVVRVSKVARYYLFKRIAEPAAS